MKNNLLAEENQHLSKGESYDAREMLVAFLDSGDSIITTDEKGVVRHVNPAYESMTGYSKEELIGKTLSIVSSGLQSKEFYKNMWDKLLKGEIFRAEFINRRKNGHLYYQSETTAPVKDNSGKIIGFVSNGRDVTGEFYQEKKFSLFGKMSSSVLLSELNDPILLIKAAAVRLRDFASKTNDLKVMKDLEVVYNTSWQMERTLGALREFFYPQFDKEATANIQNVIARAVAATEPKFTKNKIVFKVKYDEGLLMVKLQEKLWSFVFEELLHHFGSVARDSKEEIPTISLSVNQVGKEIVVNIEGGAGSPINSRGDCDKECGCVWVDGTDLRFVLMELVILEAGGAIHFEQANKDIFRATLIISNSV